VILSSCMIILKTESRIQSRLCRICVPKVDSLLCCCLSDFNQQSIACHQVVLPATEGHPLVCPVLFQALQNNLHVNSFLCFLSSELWLLWSPSELVSTFLRDITQTKSLSYFWPHSVLFIYKNDDPANTCRILSESRSAQIPSPKNVYKKKEKVKGTSIMMEVTLNV
jgi:hypothetical protein